MIDALGSPLFYVAFWSFWLTLGMLILGSAARALGRHLRDVYLSLDAVYLSLDDVCHELRRYHEKQEETGKRQ